MKALICIRDVWPHTKNCLYIAHCILYIFLYTAFLCTSAIKYIVRLRFYICRPDILEEFLYLHDALSLLLSITPLWLQCTFMHIESLIFMKK